MLPDEVAAATTPGPDAAGDDVNPSILPSGGGGRTRRLPDGGGAGATQHDGRVGTQRRAADVRFLLPELPASAALLGTPAAGVEAWRASGVRVVAGTGPAGLVVTDRAHVREAAARARSAVVVVGWPALPDPRLAGWVVRYYVVEGPPRRPRWLLETGRPVRNWFGRTWSLPRGRLRRLRNAAYVSPLGHAAARLAVATRADGVPYALREAAEAAGLPRAERWAFQLGDGDDLQRVVGHAFVRGAGRPAWVVKFSRMGGAPPRGEREQAVLARLAQQSPRSALHAAPVLGALRLHDSFATVERAAPGAALAARLLSTGPAGSRLATQAVVTWLGALAEETASPAQGQQAVRTVVEETLRHHGATALAARFGRCPAVFAHNDLGTWNVLDDGRTFTVVDWESAEPAGLPLWDLAYFATDALSLVLGPRAEPERLDWCRRLWRGELAASRLLENWLAEAARASGLADDAAAALVTASWLHHALSRERRSRWLGGVPVGEGYLGRLGGDWLSDPGLGLHWRGFGPGRASRPRRTEAASGL